MTVEALKMGVYGSYVWSSYGLTLLALIWIAVSARRDCARELQQARRRAQTAAVDNSVTAQEVQS